MAVPAPERPDSRVPVGRQWRVKVDQGSSGLRAPVNRGKRRVAGSGGALKVQVPVDPVVLVDQGGQDPVVLVDPAAVSVGPADPEASGAVLLPVTSPK